MSLGYPPLRPRPEGAKVLPQRDGEYSIPETMLDGFHSVKSALSQEHPLQFSEQHWTENREKMDHVMLRNMQGLHAPLRLTMERRTAAKINRLPCMHSSHIMDDLLSGKLDTIGFDDILNNPMDAETVGQPHALLERQAKVL